MPITITFAQEEEEGQVLEILTEYGMSYPGEIDEVLIAKDQENIVAGAKIVEFDEGKFFLEVIGVKDGIQSQGVGRSLLGQILDNPWACCKYQISEKESQPEYSMSTLARGYALGFYKKMGFEDCTLQEIPEWYRDQCDECPDRESCQPVPMIYAGGKEK